MEKSQLKAVQWSVAQSWLLPPMVVLPVSSVRHSELGEQRRKTSLWRAILGTKLFCFGGAGLFRRRVGCHS